MKNNPMEIKKIILIVLYDLCAIMLSFLLALLLVDGKVWFDVHTGLFLAVCAVTVLVFYFLFGLYKVIYSYASVTESLKIVAAVVLVGVCGIVFWLIDGVISYRNVIVFCMFLLAFTLASRFCKRLYLTLLYFLQHRTRNAVGAIIIGGGDAGSALIREMQTTDKVDYCPLCVLDDNETKIGKTISNVKIVGTTADISRAVAKYHPQEIIIAMPSAPKKEIKRILDLCGKTNCKVKTVPGTYQILTGEAGIADLKEVEITDLLGREQVKVNLDEIMGYIEQKTVLVTGGGGSIGSELCRQIASHKPKRLIILDIYENNAYDIEQELKRKYPELNLLVLIASVRDKGKIEDVFQTYRPEIVFNAAAHKHVPLMETSPNEAVKNNVFGTLNVAQAADKFEAETFVQISTDKAVNPTSVMGATKRICEMIIQTIGKNSRHTKFVAVRFGNVLGSNGSVIPLFKQQIKEGGPVTVTHKDIIRYFMTIPEAVSLVLQAGAYAKGGQIFVLDMGEPVKIYDLACNLIKLSGLKPNVDIEIKCVGLRPGEKLYEERLMDEEGMQTTPNGLINIANPIDVDEKFLWEMLKKLHKAAYEETDIMKDLVHELVPTYKVDKR